MNKEQFIALEITEEVKTLKGTVKENETALETLIIIILIQPLHPHLINNVRSYSQKHYNFYFMSLIFRFLESKNIKDTHFLLVTDLTLTYQGILCPIKS
jgi:hypothetical protein